MYISMSMQKSKSVPTSIHTVTVDVSSYDVNVYTCSHNNMLMCMHMKMFLKKHLIVHGIVPVSVNVHVYAPLTVNVHVPVHVVVDVNVNDNVNPCPSSHQYENKH